MSAIKRFQRICANLAQLQAKVKSVDRFTPQRAPVMIYDATSSELLLNMLGPRKTTILYTRGEHYYLACLLLTPLYVLFRGQSLFDSYVDSFILLSSPRVIISYIDNDLRFQLINLRHKQGKMFVSIAIQNGMRVKELVLKDANRLLARSLQSKLSVDYFFTINKDYARFFSEFVDARFVSYGGLRSNQNPSETVVNNQPPGILFISQWREGREPEYNQAELKVLELIEKWCRFNSLSLSVLASRSTHNCLEFYKRHFPSTIKVINNNKPGSPFVYEVIDSADLVCFIDSTLGYEAFARGKRVAVFPARGAQGASRCCLAFNCEHPSEGPFWTSLIDEFSVFTLLDKVYSPTNDWHSLHAMYSELVGHSPRSVQLLHLIDTAITRC